MAIVAGWQHPHLLHFAVHRSASLVHQRVEVANNKDPASHCLHSDIHCRLTTDIPLAPAEVVTDEGRFDLDVMDDLMPRTLLGTTFASYTSHVLVFQSCAKRLHATLFDGAGPPSRLTFRDTVKQHIALLNRSVHHSLLPAVLDLHSCGRGLGSYTAFLILCTVLERSIGDAFHRQCQGCRPVPHLLRDLLASSEVAAAAGPQLLHWLRVLLGPAHSLNLRNLLWHGFIDHTQFNPMYTTALVALLFDFLARQPEIDAAPCTYFRPTVSLIGLGCNVGASLVAPDDMDGMEEVPAMIRSIVEQSFFLLSGTQQEVFFAAYCWYRRSQPAIALSLLLPLLEQALRRVFVVVNAQPEWVLKGQYRVLFCTLEHILSCWIPELPSEIVAEHPTDGSEPEAAMPQATRLMLNKLRGELGHGMMDLLWDLFLNAAGPRLRDKLAHGETINHDIDAGLVKDVLVVFLLLCKQYAISPKPPPVTGDSLSTPYQMTLQNYVPCFHPRALLLRSLVTALDMWMQVYEAAVVPPSPINLQLGTQGALKSALRNLQPGPAFCPPYPSPEWQDYHCAFTPMGYAYVKLSPPPSLQTVGMDTQASLVDCVGHCLHLFGDPTVLRTLQSALSAASSSWSQSLSQLHVEDFALQLLTSSLSAGIRNTTPTGVRLRCLPFCADQLPELSDWYSFWQEEQVAATDIGLLKELRACFFSLMELNRQVLAALTAAMEVTLSQHLQLFRLVERRQASTGQRRAYGSNLLLIRPLMWMLRWLILEVERDIRSWSTEVSDEVIYRNVLKKMSQRVTLAERLRNHAVSGQMGKATLEVLRFSCSKANLSCLELLCEPVHNACCTSHHHC